MKIIDKILKIRTDRLEATNPPSRSTSSNSVSSAVSSVHDHEQGTTTDHVVGEEFERVESCLRFADSANLDNLQQL